MSEIDELKAFADEADRRGDREAAFAAMKRIESMSGQSSAIGQRAGELGTGINQGIASIVGLPVDTVQNIINLAKAGYGTAVTAAGRPDLAPDIGDEEPLMGSKYIGNRLANAGMMPNPSPEDLVGRTLQTTGRYLGASAIPIASQARGMTDIAKGLGSAAMSGLGGSAARETFPDSPTAEIIGSLAAPMIAIGATSGIRAGLRGGEESRRAMAENIEAFNRAGAQATVGQAAAGGIAHPAESLLGRSPGSIRVVSRAAQRTQEELGKTAQKIATQRSTSIEPSQAGKSIQSGIENFVSKFKSGWSRYNDNVSKHFSPEENIPVAKTKIAAEELSKIIKGAENISGELTTSKVSAISSNLLKDIGDSGTLPYQAIRELRTVIGSKIAESGLTPDVSKGQWKSLYSALSEDLKTAAADKGGAALTALNRSNKYYSSGIERIDNLLSRYNKTNTPEQAYSYAIQGSAQGATKLHALRKSLSKDQFADVVATTVNNLGKATPGKQNELGDVFSSERFLTNYMAMHPRARDALFGTGAYRSSLDNIAKVSSLIRESGSIYANPSGTGLASGTIGASGVAVGAALSGNIAVPAGILGWMGANNMAARVLVNNPRFVRWLSGTTKIKTENFPAYAARLNTIMQSEKDKEVKAAMNELVGQLGNQ